MISFFGFIQAKEKRNCVNEDSVFDGQQTLHGFWVVSVAVYLSTMLLCQSINKLENDSKRPNRGWKTVYEEEAERKNFSETRQ